MSSDPSDTTRLARALQRAESDSAVLVARLVAAWRHAFNDERLEKALGCSDATVSELSLCLRPRATTWGADVQEIAGAVGIESRRLERFFREAEIAERLAVSHLGEDNAEGRLLAARDRDESV